MPEVIQVHLHQPESIYFYLDCHSLLGYCYHFLNILFINLFVDSQSLSHNGHIFLIIDFLQLSAGVGGVSCTVTEQDSYFSIDQLIIQEQKKSKSKRINILSDFLLNLFIIIRQLGKHNTMEAHQDKVINQVAASTKQRFFEEEITYLTQFKEQLYSLNQLAKSATDPALQISKISKKIQKQFISTLQEEILYTRREISLQEINNDLHVQTKIAEVYQQKVQQYGRKLQHMQSIVQQSQERRKSKEKADFSNSGYPFKVLQTRKTVDQFIKQKQKVKTILKNRINLCGKISKIQEKQKHQILRCQQNGYKFSDYNFLKFHQGLYRNKSRDRSLLETALKFCPQKVQNVRYPIRRQLLLAFQHQIFDQQLQKIRAHNNKLQIQIRTFKQAASIREDERLLQQLNQKKNLQLEQKIARQILAFQILSRRFQEKLEKCSYKWVFQSKNGQQIKFKSKQQAWDAQRLIANRCSRPNRTRCKSAELKSIIQSLLFLPGEANKSNMKTNCSIQVLHN